MPSLPEVKDQDKTKLVLSVRLFNVCLTQCQQECLKSNLLDIAGSPEFQVIPSKVPVHPHLLTSRNPEISHILWWEYFSLILECWLDHNWKLLLLRSLASAWVKSWKPRKDSILSWDSLQLHFPRLFCLKLSQSLSWTCPRDGRPSHTDGTSHVSHPHHPQVSKGVEIQVSGFVK